MRAVVHFILILGLFSCNFKESKRIQAISRLEKIALVGQLSKPQADSLIALYKENAQSREGLPDSSLNDITRAAAVQYRYKSDVNAVRWVHDALKKAPKAADLSKTTEFLALVWRDYAYKAPIVAKMDPDDIDDTRAYLLKNKPWIDTVLIRLDRHLETNLNSGTDVADRFIRISEAYANILENGDPIKSGDLLSQGAALARSTGNFNKALQLYYRLASQFPNHPKTPQAVFLQGFIYDNDLGDYVNARKSYESFLLQFPNDEFADDAKVLLQNLGKSPEDLLKSFQKSTPNK